MKPTQEKFYVGPDGTPYRVLSDWQRAQLMRALNGDTPMAQSVADLLIEQADEIVEILSVKEKGRPKGRKDRAPRQPRQPRGDGSNSAVPDTLPQ